MAHVSVVFVSLPPSQNTACGKHPVNVCWRNSLINYVINQDGFIFPSGTFTNYSYREFIPSTVLHKSGFLLDLPGELLEPTDARTSPQTNRIQTLAGKAQVCVAVENLPQRITLCSQWWEPLQISDLAAINKLSFLFDVFTPSPISFTQIFLIGKTVFEK